VIAFGSAIGGAEAYRRYAEPGVRLASEANSEVFALAAVDSTARSYNLVLDAAAAREDLEALVLVHPHTEITDPGFCAKVRAALADHEVGLVGWAGANRVRSIAWWEGAVIASAATQRYQEHGGGELPAISWARHAPPPGDVEVLDGQLLVLSPWVVRNLRFHEDVFDHGFDVDFSLRVRRSGRKLLVADLLVRHHRSLELIPELDLWTEAHIRMAEKWDGALAPSADGEEGWKQRARFAEASREAARARAFSENLRLDARVLELERALEEKTNSVSWRATAPLRALNRWRKRLAERRCAR
jgi:hypothetical protein